MAAATRRIIPIEKCAHRARLSPIAQLLYDRLTGAMSRRECTLTLRGNHLRHVVPVFHAVLHDQPYLYDLNRARVSTSTALGRTRIRWEYHLTDDEAADYDRRIDEALRRLLRRLPEGGSPLSREAAIHDLLQDMSLTPFPGEDTPWQVHCIVGPLLEGRTVCEGAAMLFYLLCLMRGVPCQLVVGAGQGGRADEGHHAWNMVYLGRHHVHVDAYWDLCIHKPGWGHAYDYFNLSDRQMGLDHHWMERDYPACTTDRWSYFSLGHADIRTAEEFRQVALNRCREGRLLVTARMPALPAEETLTEQIREVYFPARAKSGFTSWRINPDQQVITFRIEYS